MPEQKPEFRQSSIRSLLEDEQKLPPAEIITDEDEEPPTLLPIPDEENPIKTLAKRVDKKIKNG